MLDFGFSEIVLTSAIALIVLGPEKLPKVARQVGNWMGRARSMARQLTEQLEREVDAEDLMKQTKARSTANGAAQMLPSEPMPYASPSPTSNALPSPVPPAATLDPSVDSSYSADPSYSVDPSSPPHGADWHPSPPENKSSDG